MYFDDYSIGQVLTSRGRTVTEADIVNFAGISGDFVELHMNEEYSKLGPFGRRIAHGALIFSISTGLMTQMMHDHSTMIALSGIDRMRFTAPVFIGDTVRVAMKVVDKQQKDAGRGLVVFDSTVTNQRGETVIVYTERLMLKCRA